MRCASSAPTEPLEAAIGPGAGGCCYEVGEEVHARFADFGDRVRRGRNLDLKAIAREQLERAGVEQVHDVGPVHDLLGSVAVLLSPPRSGRDGPAGGTRVVELIRGLDAETVRANLERVRSEIAGAGRDLADVQILAAVKYVAVEELKCWPRRV